MSNLAGKDRVQAGRVDPRRDRRRHLGPGVQADLERVASDDDAPNATDEDRGWGEVLTAAALQGAIFAAVKAAVDRAGATGMRRVTGRWPA